MSGISRRGGAAGGTAGMAGTAGVAGRRRSADVPHPFAFRPGRREAWLCAVAVFVLAAVARAIAAATVSFPVPEDTAYYAGTARNLVEGRGLVSDALWSYQTQPLAVPRDAFEVWLPLPAFLAAAPMWLAGSANWFRASQVFSVVVSSAGAALAWRLGADVAAEMQLPVGRARTLAVGSGVVAAFLGPLVVYGALPDSTALFGALSLVACLLMTRITAPGLPHEGRLFDRRLVALGATLGLAALTRSEAIWLGLTWVVVAWLWTSSAAGERATRSERARLILVPVAIAVLVFLPWAVRDWLAFGSPLPGQTIANALSIQPTDIYAYQDQPSLARYLAQGPAALLGMRVTGIVHNLVDVLIIPGFPVGLVGLLALPKCARLRALRPLLLVAAVTFLVTSLVFPVSTLWGTFLHASGSIFVLLAVSCLVAFDAFIAWVGRIRHWWRPVAWLGPALATAVSIPLLAVSVISLDRAADKTEARFEALPAALQRAGVPLDGSAPVITNHPIWLVEAVHAAGGKNSNTGSRGASAYVSALALPEESPESVLALAGRFHATLLIVTLDDDGRAWPAILDTSETGRRCYEAVPLTDTSGMTPEQSDALSQIRVFRIVCP